MSPTLSSTRRIKFLFYLNDKKPELLIDQISSDMSSHEEEKFWNEVLNGWDTTEDKYENRLLEKIRRRLHHLKSTASSSTDSVPSILQSNEETQKVEVRRRGR
uniref:Uncharacterized protein n=1 Tax=Panagrolaimus superbus TaxID=310955 RepID=A0A914YMN8_9BILA